MPDLSLLSWTESNIVVPSQTCRTPLATMGTDSDAYAHVMYLVLSLVCVSHIKSSLRTFFILYVSWQIWDGPCSVHDQNLTTLTCSTTSFLIFRSWCPYQNLKQFHYKFLFEIYLLHTEISLQLISLDFDHFNVFNGGTCSDASSVTFLYRPMMLQFRK